MHSLWRCTPFSRDDHLTGHHLKRGGYNVHSPLRCTPHPLMITPPCDHHSHSLYMYISPRSLCMHTYGRPDPYAYMYAELAHACAWFAHGMRAAAGASDGGGGATSGGAPLPRGSTLSLQPFSP